MSGYFTSLLDAAYGRPVPIRPRPRARFENDVGPAKEFKSQNEEIERDTPDTPAGRIPAQSGTSQPTPSAPLVVSLSPEATPSTYVQQSKPEISVFMTRTEVQRVEQLEIHERRTLILDEVPPASPKLTPLSALARETPAIPTPMGTVEAATQNTAPLQSTPFIPAAFVQSPIQPAVSPVNGDSEAHSPPPFAFSLAHVETGPLAAPEPERPNVVVSIGRLDIRIEPSTVHVPAARQRARSAVPALNDYLTSRDPQGRG
jgi:hypothetical protein